MKRVRIRTGLIVLVINVTISINHDSGVVIGIENLEKQLSMIYMQDRACYLLVLILLRWALLRYRQLGSSLVVDRKNHLARLALHVYNVSLPFHET